jgi:hypothetical protein
MNFGLHKIPEIACLIEQVLAFEGELCFIELVIVFTVDIILISLCRLLSLQRADHSFRGFLPDECVSNCV